MHQRKKDGGFPIWIQFALGTAGVVITAAAVYEFNQAPAAPTAAERPAIVTTARAPHVREAKLAASRLVEIRERREQLKRERARPRVEASRCIDGVLFEQRGDAWTNVGAC